MLSVAPGSTIAVATLTATDSASAPTRSVETPETLPVDAPAPEYASASGTDGDDCGTSTVTSPAPETLINPPTAAVFVISARSTPIAAATPPLELWIADESAAAFALVLPCADTVTPPLPTVTP